MIDGSKNSADAKMKTGADARMTSAGVKMNAGWRNSAEGTRKCVDGKNGLADYKPVVGLRRKDSTAF